MFPRGLKSTNAYLIFIKKMVKKSTQKNMRALRMIMQYKTLLLGYDIDILNSLFKFFKFKTCIFLSLSLISF